MVFAIIWRRGLHPQTPTKTKASAVPIQFFDRQHGAALVATH
jgi:hypothetical protein